MLDDHDHDAAELRVSVMNSTRALERLLEVQCVARSPELVATIASAMKVLADLEGDVSETRAKAITGESVNHNLRRTRLVESPATKSFNRGTQQAIEEIAPLFPRKYSTEELRRFARKLR